VSTLATLKAMRELLAVPERWTKLAGGRLRDGSECQPTNRHVMSVCLVGAECRIRETDQLPVASACEELGKLLSPWNGDPAWAHYENAKAAMDWQNAPERTHAEVLALLDRAIAQVEAAP
jgi:hypothetical protein